MSSLQCREKGNRRFSFFSFASSRVLLYLTIILFFNHHWLSDSWSYWSLGFNLIHRYFFLTFLSDFSVWSGSQCRNLTYIIHGMVICWYFADKACLQLAVHNQQDNRHIIWHTIFFTCFNVWYYIMDAQLHCLNVFTHLRQISNNYININ